LDAGSLDIACQVGPPPIAAVSSQGIPLKVFWIQDNAGEPLALRGGGSVKDLAGKKIGVIVGTTMYFALVTALNHNKVPLKDVTIVDLPLDATVAAFKAGQIDGADLPHPWIDEIVAAGAQIIMTPEQRQNEFGLSLFDGCVTSAAFDQAHPDVLLRWVQTEDAAIAYYKANPAAGAQAVATKMGITPELAATGINAQTHPTAAEQTQMSWLGAPGGKGSGAATAISIVAALELGLGRIATVPSDTDSIIDPTYVNDVAAHQGTSSPSPSGTP
jgi:taurine transport system substrate-binding protein